MPRNILITGGSGYLGGSLLAELKNTDLPAHGTIYALVRSDEQAEKVKANYNATPITLDLEDQSAITATLLEKQISVVFHLISAVSAESQEKFIQGLGKVKEQLEVETHFLHTSGAKIFSSFAAHPTDRALSDTDDGLYEIQKSVAPKLPLFQQVRNLNTSQVFITNVEFLGCRGEQQDYRSRGEVWCKDLHLHAVYCIWQGHRFR
jgi:NAD(P)-dependent dehydrogenase (short-subunit alcohol dehydrogenase family)